MARKSFALLVAGTVMLFLCSVSSADVPNVINYQGKLTTPGVALVNDTVQMTFSIYPDTLGSPAVWADTQAQVVVKDGIFNVLLGSVNPIPDTVFDGSVKFLGVQVESDPEMRPLKPMVSVAYAYRAGTADGGEANSGWVDDGTVVRLETNTDSVGIGTTIPAAKLEVVGDVRISGKATIGPGHTNTGTNAFVAGKDNSATREYTTIGGGKDNSATREYSTIGGGTDNVTSNFYATVGGGWRNIANAQYATIGGGMYNTASGPRATIAGGDYNTASQYLTTIAGGFYNFATGACAIVAGGLENTAAGEYSFVAGHKVKLTSTADFTFAFGDSFTTSADSAVIFYVAGNEMKLGIQDTSPTNILTVKQNSTTDPIADAWTTYASKEYKRDIHELTPEEYQEALKKVVSIPVVKFHYKGEDTKEKIGLIAEEAPKEILAEGDNKAISLNEYISLLHAALKAQQEQIDALKAVVNELTKE